jgi:beta-barrel assembly-enhancing protease
VRASWRELRSPNRCTVLGKAKYGDSHGAAPRVKPMTMKPSRFLGICLVLVLGGCAANKSTHLSASQRAEITQIDAALKLVGEQHFAEAEGVIQPVIHAKHFERLPSGEQYRALLTAAKLAFTLKHPRLEYDSRVRLLALPEATAEDRVSRVNAAYRLQDTGEIIIGLTQLVQKSPEKLGESTERFILRSLRDAKKQLPHGAAMPLMQALYAAHWKLKWDQEPSGIWQDFALLLLEQNRLTEAIDVSSHVTDEYGVISMRADRRFDAITAANPPQFDVGAVLKRNLEHFQAAAERVPKSLTPRVVVIDDLMELQRYGAALAAADGLVAEIRVHVDAKQWYDDFDDQYAWILDSRSRLLRRVDRWEEGVDQLAAASWVLDKDGKNVSQVINLGELYCDLGKPKEALGVLVRLGTDMSSYGRMQEASVRLDAAVQLGDSEQIEEWLAFIREHRVDAPRTYEDALLLMNDAETAAKWLIQRLEDRDLRSATLLNLQEYAVPRETPRQAELRKRRRDLMIRADVQAEIQKVGRIEKYNLEALGH